MEIKISEHDLDRIIISSMNEICRVFWTLLLTNALTDVMKLVIATGQPLLSRQCSTATIRRQARCRKVLSVYTNLTQTKKKLHKITAVEYLHLLEYSRRYLRSPESGKYSEVLQLPIDNY